VREFGRKQLARLSMLAAVAALAACTAGPDYRRPPVEVPSSYKEDSGSWRPAAPRDDIDRGPWWAIYRDPILDGLEREVDVSNQNLKAAEAAYREASAAVAEARAGLFPHVTVGASAGHMNGTMPRPTLPNSLYGTATWAPDVWGRIRREVERDTAEAAASGADLASARLSMQAVLATDYFELRAEDEAARLLQLTASSERTGLQIAQRQYDTGTGDLADVLAAQSQLEDVEARALNVGVRRTRLEHAIAVLIGKPPAEFSLKAAPYRDEMPGVPPGVPSALLERRPDIAAAERRMAAANAEIGIATAAWYPDLTLSVSSGYAGMVLSQLLQASNRFWAIGPELTEAAFDAGARKARVSRARAAYDRSVAQYRETVLTAFQQIEDNLAALRILTEQRKVQEASVRHAQAAEQLALAQYASGLAPYSRALAARSARLADEDALLAVRRERLAASVALIEALGGGWKAAGAPAG